MFPQAFTAEPQRTQRLRRERIQIHGASNPFKPLELAIAAGCIYIVAYDVKDFSSVKPYSYRE
jgi:hypothetical protein